MAIHRTIKTKTSGRKWKSIDGETLKAMLSLDAYAILIYILGKKNDWKNARGLINGDIAKNGVTVGNYGKAFFTALDYK